MLLWLMYSFRAPLDLILSAICALQPWCDRSIRPYVYVPPTDALKGPCLFVDRFSPDVFVDNFVEYGHFHNACLRQIPLFTIFC